jgi:UDP-3-O-[3-hydroxymyristoyl] N-acetylglucosamine deacetylase / 3-hydroxyacyl-[acyl-carrier-protein] dehydratase
VELCSRKTDGARIGTIEHTLAATGTGMGLDNVLIEVDNEEAPIIDGSSRVFVEAIESAGLLSRKQKENTLKLPGKLFTATKKPAPNLSPFLMRITA